MENISESQESYIEGHMDPEPENLHRLRRAANIHLNNGRMVSGHLQGRLLKMLTSLTAPQRALELGTFAGYSALCIAEGLPEGGKLLTVEHNDELEDFILARFAESPYGDRITLETGDALNVCRSLADKSIDLMFIDADKRAYPAYWKEARRLVRPGGVIIADNTLWGGHVCDPAYTKDRQTAGIMEFNRLVAEDEGVEKVIIPLRDGLTVIRVR